MSPRFYTLASWLCPAVVARDRYHGECGLLSVSHILDTVICQGFPGVDVKTGQRCLSVKQRRDNSTTVPLRIDLKT